jgi:transposase
MIGWPCQARPLRREEAGLDVIIDRCAGLDVGKDEVVACVRTPSPSGKSRRAELRVFPTFTSGLEDLAAWLQANGVTDVVMEATGQYWKPIWYVLEDQPFALKLVNAKHVKMVPGRKTDMADAAWLAELLEHGLLRASFVPPAEIRELRDLTRYRKRLIQTHTAEQQRVQKILEDAGIKLDSVASDVLGVSGRAMLHALIDGERDPDRLADLAQGVLRKKIPLLREALRGRFRQHHATMLRIVFEHIEQLETSIAQLDTEIDRLMIPFSRERDHLDTITGVGKRAAECIIAEIGIDMTRFPTAAHLESWAGMCPGNNITGGKRRSGTTTKGNRWLGEILNQCAAAASRTRDTYLGAQYWRLTRRIGKRKAAVAVGHSILVIAWHLLANDCDYNDLGGDWFARRTDTDKRRDHLIRQLQDLGYGVTLTNLAA